MISDEEFNNIHENILIKLSTLQQTQSFILTNTQLNQVITNNKKINKPKVIINTKHWDFKIDNNINIRDFVLDKLRKYKIVDVKIGNYGKFKYKIVYGPGGGGTGGFTSFLYIIYINIHGDCYGNLQLEIPYPHKSNNSVNVNDWFLELFIKPFAIKPEYINNYNIDNSPFNICYNGLKWMPFIEPEIYKSMEEPKYKEYINTDKIIHIETINNLINDKININVIKKLHPNIDYPDYINFFGYCYLTSLYKTNKISNNVIYNPFNKLNYSQDSYNCIDGTYKDRDGLYLNMYSYYEEYKNEMKRVREYNLKIKYLDSKVSSIINNNTLIIKNYYKPELDLRNYLPTIKIIKNGGYINSNHTNINIVEIYDSDFVSITGYYDGIKIIKLYNCPKFYYMPEELQKKLTSFYIDNSLIHIENSLIHIEKSKKDKHESNEQSMKNKDMCDKLIQTDKYELKIKNLNLIDILKKPVETIIKDNILIIKNYNEQELNLCDYLPKIVKQIIKDQKIININCTNIDTIEIHNSNFNKISKYYQGIKYIKLYNCPNYQSMPHYLKNDLTEFYIDNILK